MPPIRYATARDGTRIAWTKIPGESPPFLMVNGVGSPGVTAFFKISTRAAHLRELRRDRAAVLFDWRGSGLSDRPSGPIVASDLVDDLDAVTRAVGEAVDAFVTGNACFPAACLAATSPDVFRAMVFSRPALTLMGLSAMAGGTFTFLPANDDAYRVFTRNILRSEQALSFEEAENASEEWIRNVPLEVRARYIAALETFDLTSILPGIRVPVAVLCLPGREVEREFASRLPGVRIEHQDSLALVSAESGRERRSVFDRLVPPATEQPLLGHWQPLSAREAEVLRLLAHGRTNAQVAAELVITEATVARHVHNILVKLDCANRAEAAAWAARNGMA